MPEFVEAFLRGLVMVAAIITFTRLQGLRSFSKLSSFDFSLTVAFGSILAGTILAPGQSIWIGLAALATIYLIQFVLAILRRKSETVRNTIDNRPLLLMDGPEILSDNLASAQVTKADIMAKLREANVLRLDQVHAVVLESTGDVSVLHSGDDADLDTMLDGVQR